METVNSEKPEVQPKKVWQKVARHFPYSYKVEKGKTYSWCACGLSKTQPFCDGSHIKEGIFEPIQYTATETKTVKFCGCKFSQTKPICDKTHVELLIRKYGRWLVMNPFPLYFITIVPAVLVFNNYMSPKKYKAWKAAQENEE
jgi:CDGSH-type Zn-finger protein